MKKTILLTFGILLLCGFSQAISAQTAKYNSNDQVIAISGLLEMTEGCAKSKIHQGTITKVERNVEDGWLNLSVTVKAVNGSKNTIEFLIETDHELTATLKSWMVKNKKAKIQARRCGSSGMWSAETVWKMN